MYFLWKQRSWLLWPTLHDAWYYGRGLHHRKLQNGGIWILRISCCIDNAMKIPSHNGNPRIIEANCGMLWLRLVGKGSKCPILFNYAWLHWSRAAARRPTSGDRFEASCKGTCRDMWWTEYHMTTSSACNVDFEGCNFYLPSSTFRLRAERSDTRVGRQETLWITQSSPSQMRFTSRRRSWCRDVSITRFRSSRKAH